MASCDLRCDRDESESNIWDNCSTCPGRDRSKPFPVAANNIKFRRAGLAIGYFRYHDNWSTGNNDFGIGSHDWYGEICFFVNLRLKNHKTWLQYKPADIAGICTCNCC